LLEFYFTLIWRITFEDLNAFWFLHMHKNLADTWCLLFDIKHNFLCPLLNVKKFETTVF